MVFGRTGCQEDRDFKVRVYFSTSDDHRLDIAEQLAEKEAREICDKFKVELLDKKKESIEIIKDSEEWCLMKSHIVSVVLFRD